VEIELLMHFCLLIKKSGIKIEKMAVLRNMYETQLKKISKAIETLHEDLQYDYGRKLKEL
jgi:hypothetical protein